MSENELNLNVTSSPAQDDVKRENQKTINPFDGFFSNSNFHLNSLANQAGRNVKKQQNYRKASRLIKGQTHVLSDSFCFISAWMNFTEKMFAREQNKVRREVIL